MLPFSGLGGDGTATVLGGGSGGGMTNPMTAVGDIIAGSAPIVGGLATPARLAAGSAGYILRVVGGTPAWRELFDPGPGAARPGAASTREGQWYWSTDAAAGLELAVCTHQGGSTYAWVTVPYGVTSTGVALVQAADAAAGRAVIFPDPAGPFSTADFLYTAGGNAGGVGYVEPSLGPGTSLVFAVHKRAEVGGGVHVIMTHISNYGAPVTGWYSHIWSTGSWTLTLTGLGGWEILDWATLSLGRHVVAMSLRTTTGSTVELWVSIDGAAPVSRGTVTGTYAPPTTGDDLFVGRSNVGGFERPNTVADLYAVMVTSTAVSNADLQVLSAATGTLPTVATGTVTFHLNIPGDLAPGYRFIRPTVGAWLIGVMGSLGRRMA